MAGKITIAEVEQLVPSGELDPDFIHTPGIYVQGYSREKIMKKGLNRGPVEKVSKVISYFPVIKSIIPKCHLIKTR